VLHHVKRYKSATFEIELDTQFAANQQTEAVLKQAEAKLPPDLRGDDLMNEQKVMEWSAPPSAAPSMPEPDMPLTGEVPMSEGGE
jgi:hypothetical protein